MKPVCVSTHINKALKGYRFRSDEDFNVMVVPWFQQWPRDFSRTGVWADESMGCLPQCLWDLHLVSSVTLSRTIPILVSFEQPLYTYE